MELGRSGRTIDHVDRTIAAAAVGAGELSEVHLRGLRQQIAKSAALVVSLNVELSLPIFRLALAVFIPWRGADGFDRRAGWHPR
jgi:hypothetical protein